MEPDTTGRSNGLPFFSKLLGAGYLLNAALILSFGVSRLILFFNALAEHVSELNLLVVMPFVFFAIICLLFVAGSTVLGLRLFAGKRNWPTWTLTCIFLLCIPIGTILGILTFIWLILSRRAQQQPASG